MSPCFIRRLTPDGLQPVDYSAASLAEAAQYESADGVYTVANTFNTYQVLMFDAHLDRLENSAKYAGIPLNLNREYLRKNLRAMIEQADFGSVRFRITVERDNPESLLLSLEPYHPPSAELIEHGVKCATVADNHRVNPVVKTTDWMHNRKQITLPADVYEGLLIDDAGNILEGMSSNFYAVLAGELRTAKEGVLQGIARRIVVEIAPSVLPVKWQPVNLNDLAHISEALMTSSSRGIIPIVQIDDVTIGAGKRGPITESLQQAYNQWVAQHLEDL
ncbi:MAG: hypothetical protein D6737_02700 [Chloroflexi bacterium]|nr:MAG: hypothetical protein CUN54_03785 [Phototrophicales bacterium]RMF82215.1 MAG: hypothetical protein D6737_02700 [Chloroflexota bacterium]